MSDEKQGLTIDDVIEEWKVDCTIDESRLSHEIIRTPSLHAKYLGYFVKFKGVVSNAKSSLGKMGNIKRRYYRGECTKKELDRFGWEQYQGLKPSLSEMNNLLEFDKDMVYYKKELNDAEAAVQAIEYVMKQIASRDYVLRTFLDTQKFLVGSM